MADDNCGGAVVSNHVTDASRFVCSYLSSPLQQDTTRERQHAALVTMVNSTDAKESGISAWMASVRTSMANDPCRQLFEDQLQTHAFIFLDDYLEHILAGPKQA